ncbi:hypothetical protein [Rubrolithibacter danxiaensis]|uniref:hypothetical protein n=1 Tax=Rubrolithibacter danxiaensis TaxID=3390805 RepID=UPI003BF88152
MTLIDWYVPTSIWFLTGLIATPFTSTYLSEYYKTTNFFLHAVFNICTWGGLVICAMMIINYNFPTGAETQIKVKALNYGHLAKGKSGCAVPYVDVNIKGLNKELIFPCDFEVEKYKSVNVTIQEGFFGIDILTEKKIMVD